MPYIDERGIAKIVTVTGIDLKTVTTTLLYTVPIGKTLVVDHIVIRTTSYDGTGKTVNPVISFGSNSATYDNYLNSVTYTFSANNEMIRDSIEDTAVTAHVAGSEFRTSVETASDGTTETVAVDVFGYLF